MEYRITNLMALYEDDIINIEDNLLLGLPFRCVQVRAFQKILYHREIIFCKRCSRIRKKCCEVG